MLGMCHIKQQKQTRTCPATIINMHNNNNNNNTKFI